jgi:hypothetical protein
MVEIKCSKRQKKKIINALLSPEGCLWPRSSKMCGFDYTRSCEACFEKKIKWILTDEKKRHENES